MGIQALPVLSAHPVLSTSGASPSPSSASASASSASSPGATGRSEASFARRQSHAGEEGWGAGGVSGGKQATPTIRLPGLVKAWLVACDAEAASAARAAAPRLPSARDRAAGVQPEPADIPALNHALDMLHSTGVHAEQPLELTLSLRSACAVLDKAGVHPDVLAACGLVQVDGEEEEEGDMGDELRVSLAAVLAGLQSVAAHDAELGRLLHPAPYSLPLSPCEVLVA